ncbi:MAG TPA: phosphoribosylanthranilate isomerase [Candidatus Polarisedimenticolia bacterium]|nr:phosphoribosylanthranilate isomerase [Candidatus Polarisedimenticolia bacterium]
MVRVKVCGITRLEDALLAIGLGVDALGFNFVPGSPRRVSPEQARAISSALPPFVTKVGVFADELPRVMEATVLLAGLNCLQLHGEEPPEACAEIALPWFKAHRVGPDFQARTVTRYHSTTFLLDSRVEGMKGGTGRPFDWTVAREASAYGRAIIAGGLTPDNVERAIAVARPYAVDVNSGIESAPGQKERRLLREFMRRVRRASAGEEEER